MVKSQLPRDDIYDNAILSVSMEGIKDLLQKNGSLVLIRERGNHFSVEPFHKISGEPEWAIDLWFPIPPSITDSYEHARKLADEFLNTFTNQVEDRSSY